MYFFILNYIESGHLRLVRAQMRRQLRFQRFDIFYELKHSKGKPKNLRFLIVICMYCIHNVQNTVNFINEIKITHTDIHYTVHSSPLTILTVEKYSDPNMLSKEIFFIKIASEITKYSTLIRIKYGKPMWTKGICHGHCS